MEKKGYHSSYSVHYTSLHKVTVIDSLVEAGNFRQMWPRNMPDQRIEDRSFVVTRSLKPAPYQPSVDL